MPTAISDANKLAEFVQPAKLAAAGFLQPTRVSVIAGTDHSGTEAYYVYLIFPDETPDTDLAWSKVKPMVRWVRDQIREADGEQRWPYVRVMRECEPLI